MFRAATILRNARLDKELDFQEIAKKIKVPAKYLKAIEEEQVDAFPNEPYCSLIVKDYADFLSLDGQHILKLFHRDFEEKRQAQNTSLPKTIITPQFTFTLFVSFSLILFFVYLTFEYIKFNRPPKLQVNWPTGSAVIVDITGITDPEATVRVNDDLVIVDQSGKFSKRINLPVDGGEVIVESKSQSGKTTRDEKFLK
jgi:hypothetical protein